MPLDINLEGQQFKEQVMEKEEPKPDFAKEGAYPKFSWGPGHATSEGASLRGRGGRSSEGFVSAVAWGLG